MVAFANPAYQDIGNTVGAADGIDAIKSIGDSSVHLILSDIPYGIGLDEWDVLHDNTNSALLGTSCTVVSAKGANTPPTAFQMRMLVMLTS